MIDSACESQNPYWVVALFFKDYPKLNKNKHVKPSLLRRVQPKIENMKTRFTLLWIFVMVAFAACTKPQEKLKGTWYFSEVTERTGSFSNMDVTGAHRDYELQFIPGGSLVHKNIRTGDSWRGNWQLTKINVSTGEESTTEQILVLTFPTTTPIFETITVLNSVSVTRSNLRGTSNDQQGRWYRKYVLNHTQ